MNTSWLRWGAWNVGGTALGFYVGYGALLWSLQEPLLFPAPGGISRESLDLGAREVGATPIEIETSDHVQLYGWHYQGTGRRLVLYFPGNAETVAGNIPLHRLLVNHDWDVAVLAYRGYPGSLGSPTEVGLVRDAEAFWDWALSAGYDPAHIVLHGRSLGGAVAAHLAERRNPASLVLESTFRSMRAVAKRYAPLHPVDWMLRHPFDTEARAPLVGVPTLIVHSSADRVIPEEVSAFRVRDRFAEQESILAEGWTHGHCLPVASSTVQQAYLSFLDQSVPIGSM